MKIEIQDIDRSVNLLELIENMDKAFKKSGIETPAECIYYQPVTTPDPSHSENTHIDTAHEIARDISNNNYGIAWLKATKLAAQLEDIQQKAKSRPALIPPSAFERQIEKFISHLEMPARCPQHAEYYNGMKTAYRYALAIYRRTI